jgi:hypothetical protein
MVSREWVLAVVIMKHVYEITLGQARPGQPESGRYLSPTLYEECRRRWPQFFTTFPAAMFVKNEKEDPELNEVIAFLRQHGREPHLRINPRISLDHPKMYQVEGRRVFEAKDLERGEYFYFYPDKWIAEGGHTITGYTDLHEVKGGTVTQQPIGSNGTYFVSLCSDELRRELEEERFLGLSFREVLITGKARRGPLWQLWSDRQMPPIRNRIIDEDGNDVDPKARRGRRIDDFYFPYLLKFRAEQVRAMEPFDAALTQERFGNSVGQYFPADGIYENKLDPILIVSRRFYQWCEGRKLKISWHPIVLE